MAGSFTPSNFDRLSQYVNGLDNRAYCLLLRRARRFSPVVIALIHGGISRLSWPRRLGKYRRTVTHLSQYQTGPMYSNFVDELFS